MGTDKDLKTYLFVLTLSVIFLGMSVSFRGDEMIRQIKIAQHLEEYDHLKTGWRAVVAGTAWLLYILLGPFVVAAAFRLWRDIK